MSDERQIVKFVILCTGLGNWRQGDVIPREEFLSRGIDIKRHIALGGMREALPSEVNLAHVDIADVKRDPSFQHSLAEKDAQILSLREQVQELQGRLGRPISPMEQTQAVNALVEQKDKVISDLNAKIMELPTRDREIAQLRRDLADANAKVSIMETQARAMGPAANMPPMHNEELAQTEARLKELQEQSQPRTGPGPARKPAPAPK